MKLLISLSLLAALAIGCLAPVVAEPEAKAPEKKPAGVRRMDFKDDQMTGGCTLSVFWFDGERYGIVHVPSLCPKCKPKFD